MGDDSDGFIAKLKAAKEVVGAIALIGGLVVAGASFLFEEAMEERDETAKELAAALTTLTEAHTAEVAALKDRIGKLESAQEVTLDATRERFQQNEIVNTEVRGSVAALRGEVRIRHREDPDGYGVSMGTVRLRASAEETDRMLIRAENAQPQSTPLLGL